jgi:purine-binding chemotaxis protein CheW
MATDETVVTFGLGDAVFALPVAPVLEILDARDAAPLPRAPAHLLGLIDRRGASVPVVDLRRLLGLPERADTPDTRIIVLGLAAQAPAEDGPGAALPGTVPAGADGPHDGASSPDGARARSVGLRVDRVIEVTALDDAGSAPLCEAGLLHWNERLVAGIGRRGGAFVSVLDVAGLFAGEPGALPAAV